MKTTIAITAAALVALSTTAFAGAHTQGLESSANAKAMAENIKTFGGSTAKQLNQRGALPQEPSNRGWGNAGSAATGAGALDSNEVTATPGGQVSKRGNNDN